MAIGTTEQQAGGPRGHGAPYLRQEVRQRRTRLGDILDLCELIGIIVVGSVRQFYIPANRSRTSPVVSSVVRHVLCALTAEDRLLA